MSLRVFLFSLCLAGALTALADTSARIGKQSLKGTLGGIPCIALRSIRLLTVRLGLKSTGVSMNRFGLDTLLRQYDCRCSCTGEPAEYETEIRLIATERGLFVSALMKQPLDSLTKRLTPRDQFIDRDTFGITIDPSGQGFLPIGLYRAGRCGHGWQGVTRTSLLE